MSHESLLSESAGSRASTLPSPFVCSHTGGGRDAVWVHVAGELDISSSPRLESQLRELHTEARLLVLDLRDVEFVDSSGVHAIVDATFRARRAGRRLVVLRDPATVDRVFTLTGHFDDVEIGDIHPAEPPVQVLLQLAQENAVELAITDMPPSGPIGHAARPAGVLRALSALLGLRRRGAEASRDADWLGSPPLDAYTLRDGKLAR